MEEKVFRNYEAPDISAAVKEHYRKMRKRQTVDYVQSMHKKYLKFDKPLDLWEAMRHLNSLIDVSDPDLDLPNVQHLIQSAEAIRAEGRPDWDAISRSHSRSWQSHVPLGKRRGWYQPGRTMGHGR